MKNYELFLAEVRKRAVAVYLSCDESVATDLSNTLETLCVLLEDCVSEIEGYSRVSADGAYYTADEARDFLKELDEKLRV